MSQETFTCPLCLGHVSKEQESPFLQCASCRGHPHNTCLGDGGLARLSGEIGWLCPTCCKKFTLQLLPIRKIVDFKYKSDLKSTKFKCPTCCKLFSSKKGLTSHQIHRSNMRCNKSAPPPPPPTPGEFMRWDKVEKRLHSWRERVTGVKRKVEHQNQSVKVSKITRLDVTTPLEVYILQ